MSEQANAAMSEGRQFTKNKWFFGLGSAGRDFGYALVSSFLLTYIQFGIQLSVAQFAVISVSIGVAGRIWDGINDPMMGAIIEGTHFKWGKFKPWIFIGGILCGIFTVFMFNIRPEGWAFVIFIIVIYLFYETSFTINDIGFYSMLPALTSDKKRRNTLMVFTILFSGIGGALLQGMVSLFSPGNILVAYGLFSIIAGALFIGSQALTSFGVKEPPRPVSEQGAGISFKEMIKTIKKNDQLLWMSLALLCYNLSSGMLGAFAYNIYYLEIGYNGDVFFLLIAFGAATILTQPLYPKLAAKFTRRQLQTFSAITALTGNACLFLIGWFPFLPLNIFTLALSGVLIIAGQSIFYMTEMINITNCVEYNEYRFGKRSEAVVSTMRPLIVKFADAIKYGIVTLVLVGSGVFMLSQNISAAETQKGYFDKTAAITVGAEDYTVAEAQRYYLIKVSGYIDNLEAAEGTENYDALVISAQEDFDSDPILTRCRIDADSLVTLKNLRVFSGDTYISTLGGYNDIAREEYGSYTILISGSYTEGGQTVEFNEGNAIFTERATTSMRLWLRVTVSGAAALFLFAAWQIQRKKYIIDEKYYDNMILEIEKRKDDCSASLADRRK